MKSNNQEIFMIVRIANHYLALNIKNIKSIVDENRIIKASSLVDGIHGIINVGNILIPIFDASLKAGFGVSKDSEHNRILLLHSRIQDYDIIFGLLINDIFKILNIADLKKNNELANSDPKLYRQIEIFNCQEYLSSNDIKLIQEFYNINNEFFIE